MLMPFFLNSATAVSSFASVLFALPASIWWRSGISSLPSKFRRLAREEEKQVRLRRTVSWREMRGVNVERRSANNAVDTVHAAANAIASAETRVAPLTSQKRRWGGFWSISCCFGSQKYSKRIGHAILVSEATSSTAEAPPPARSLGQPPPIVVPFAAPPSSPASFRPSEPPSAAQSPAGLVSLTSISANIYSPGRRPRSVFTVGPYANETQIVSPPVFSTYTTEPSTAPFTPPPESVHLTTTSSPEVPFAQLLNPRFRTGDFGQRFAPSQYEYQMYQYYPGSPVGQLISPGSAISGSGTSSPFPDPEYYAGGLHYPDIRFRVTPKLLNLQSLPARDWGSHQGSGTLTPDAIRPKSQDNFLLDHQYSTVSPLSSLPNGHHKHETVIDQRGLTAEDVVRCVVKGCKSLPKGLQTVDSEEGHEHANSLADNSSSNSIDKTPSEDVTKKTPPPADAEERQPCQKQRSASLGSIKEFNFDNGKREDSQKPCISSDWWANEQVLGKGGEQPGNWSFFPVAEPDVN